MSNEKLLNINTGNEVDRYFDDSSIPHGEQPCIVIITGGVAVGKTTLRKQHYSTGYVLVDAAEIFLSLSRGGSFPFPGAFEKPMAVIGGLVARRAVYERRHIVTELIGADLEPIEALVDAMRAIGYIVNVAGVTCDIEEALLRNSNRSDDCISAYYAEPYQRGWLLEAAQSALNTNEANA